MIAAVMDAMSIIPSMAMLMMPQRSAKMPENAPSVIGTASKTALESIPARLNDLPAACQTKKRASITAQPLQPSGWFAFKSLDQLEQTNNEHDGSHDQQSQS